MREVSKQNANDNIYIMPWHSDIGHPVLFKLRSGVCEQWMTATMQWNFARRDAMNTYRLYVWNTRWFKYDRDKLWLVYTQIIPVIFEPPCTIQTPHFWVDSIVGQHVTPFVRLSWLWIPDESKIMNAEVCGPLYIWGVCINPKGAFKAGTFLFRRIFDRTWT